MKRIVSIVLIYNHSQHDFNLHSHSHSTLWNNTYIYILFLYITDRLDWYCMACRLKKATTLPWQQYETYDIPQSAEVLPNECRRLLHWFSHRFWGHLCVVSHTTRKEHYSYLPFLIFVFLSFFIPILSLFLFLLCSTFSLFYSILFYNIL